MKKVTPQAGTHLRVSTTFAGQEREKSYHKSEITIGRANGVANPDLDLSPDVNVSRRHARLWVEDGDFWVEDLGSKFGTLVDGERVYPGLKAGVKNDSIVQIGDTLLRIGQGTGDAELSTETQFGITPALEICESIDASMRGFDLAQTASTEIMARQALLMDLPLEFSGPASLDALVQTIVKRAVETIPGAKRGTLLLRRTGTEALAIAAFVSEQDPAVSETLARRTLTEQKGFIWRRGAEGDAQHNGHRQRTESGMYVPLLHQNRPLGVICVDNPHRDCAFSDDDLRLLLTIAHQAAIFIVSRQLADEQRENSTAMERLPAGFSPKLRARLLSRAREGQLQPALEKSEVTVLRVEIRGFSRNGEVKDPVVVLESLNRLFTVLTEVVFSQDGTVHQFTGGSLLASFGGLVESEPVRHERAVRAAWAMKKAVREMHSQSAGDGAAICELGIGIHCGEVLHGFVGSEDRLGCVIIGDAVKAVARFSSEAASGEILVSDEFYERVAEFVQAERLSPETRPEINVTGYSIKGLNR